VNITRYRFAKAAYVKYFTSRFSQAVIDEQIEMLSQLEVKSSFQENDRKASIEALQCCNNMSLPELSEYSLKPVGNKKMTEIEGVEVKVNPNVIIRGTYRGRKFVGAIKFHIIKTNTLSDEAKKTVATLLHKFVEEHLKEEDEIAPPQFIYSIDIFSGKHETAPKSFKRRREDIVAACEEYAARWEKI
jgi:hypothetical protein